MTTVFVFGSNLAGRHGAGAAQAALTWGAKYGEGMGRVGNTYAIPTKDALLLSLPLSGVRKYVKDFLAYAEQHPDTAFLVTQVGCGLAGNLECDIAPMFIGAPSNCTLPLGWRS